MLLDFFLYTARRKSRKKNDIKKSPETQACWCLEGFWNDNVDRVVVISMPVMMIDCESSIYVPDQKEGRVYRLSCLLVFIPSFFPVECNKERGLKFEESNAQSRVQKEQRNMESIVPVSLLHGHRM